MIEMPGMKPNGLNPSNLQPIAQDKEAFSEILRLIVAARQRAFHAVNAELIDLYWEVGAIISRKIEAAEWGDGVVDAGRVHSQNAARYAALLVLTYLE
jgi:DUF1016 N-terminal domain